jgi:hypothetical protein
MSESQQRSGSSVEFSRLDRSIDRHLPAPWWNDAAKSLRGGGQKFPAAAVTATSPRHDFFYHRRRRSVPSPSNPLPGNRIPPLIPSSEMKKPANHRR